MIFRGIKAMYGMCVPEKHLMFRLGDFVLYTPDRYDPLYQIPAVVTEVSDGSRLYMISFQDTTGLPYTTSEPAKKLKKVVLHCRGG